MSEPTLKARPADRAPESLRPVQIELDPLKWAEGSALIRFGDTHVLCSVSVEDRVPPWRRDSGSGWMTAEYSMLPRSTSTRNQREVSKGKVSGRTAEIQRLIGRSMRAAVDLDRMPDRTLMIDCDVIQADGGTRTASITGAYVAATRALATLLLRGDIKQWPLIEQVAAVSVGIVGGAPVLDLEYVEDQAADVDMNVVATASGQLIEIQGTAEGATFTRAEMDRMVDLALAGIGELATLQNEVLAPTLKEVEAVLARGSRKPAEPKDEAAIWGRP